MQPDKEVVKLSKQLLGLKFMKAGGDEEQKREEKKSVKPLFGQQTLEILDLLEDKSSLSLAKLKVNQSMSKKKYKEEESKKKIGKRKMLEKKEEPIIKKKEKRHE